jgi:hypothetical protein
VLPLGLASQANRLYLIARRDGSEKSILFAIPRIRSARRCAGVTFKYPDDFDLQGFANTELKFRSSEEVINLKARLKDSHLVQTLRESPLNVTFPPN